MANDDGGPAFPVPSYVNVDGETFESKPQGMTLRDWFAGQALAGWGQYHGSVRASRAADLFEGAESHPYDDLGGQQLWAQWAYQVAEAMLAERAKRQSEDRT